MNIAPAKFLKLTRIYLDKYTAIPEEADQSALLAIAAEYDAWFRDMAVPYIESLLVIDGGVWQPNPEAPAAAGRFIKDGAATIIVDGVSRWLTDDGDNANDQPRIADYYIRGLELWRLNLEMQGQPFPRKLKLTDIDLAIIDSYYRAFVDTQQDHLARHERHMRRAVHTATMEGWTTERFLDSTTAPDGHIVGFRYGNASYSWHEHLRRFGKGKMRMMAQIAQQSRMVG